MIEKFLIQFCAPEVRTMVIRLNERPEDFGYGSKWRDLVQAREGFTLVERKVLGNEWAKFKKNEKRRELLGLITKEIINPTPKDGLWGYIQPSANNATAQLKAQMNAMQSSAHAQQLYGYQDSRAIYGNNNV